MFDSEVNSSYLTTSITVVQHIVRQPPKKSPVTYGVLPDQRRSSPTRKTRAVIVADRVHWRPGLPASPARRDGCLTLVSMPAFPTKGDLCRADANRQFVHSGLSSKQDIQNRTWSPRMSSVPKLGMNTSSAFLAGRIKSHRTGLNLACSWRAAADGSLGC